MQFNRFSLISLIFSCLFLSFLWVVYHRDIETQIKVGKKVREIRISKCLTQEELAYKSDLDISQINRIELGKINGSISVLSRIAKSLQIHIKELFDFD